MVTHDVFAPGWLRRRILWETTLVKEAAVILQKRPLRDTFAFVRENAEIDLQLPDMEGRNRSRSN